MESRSLALVALGDELYLHHHVRHVNLLVAVQVGSLVDQVVQILAQYAVGQQQHVLHVGHAVLVQVAGGGTGNLRLLTHQSACLVVDVLRNHAVGIGHLLRFAVLAVAVADGVALPVGHRRHAVQLVVGVGDALAVGIFDGRHVAVVVILVAHRIERGASLIVDHGGAVEAVVAEGKFRLGRRHRLDAHLAVVDVFVHAVVLHAAQFVVGIVQTGAVGLDVCLHRTVLVVLILLGGAAKGHAGQPVGGIVVGQRGGTS